MGVDAERSAIAKLHVERSRLIVRAVILIVAKRPEDCNESLQFVANDQSCVASADNPDCGL